MDEFEDILVEGLKDRYHIYRKFIDMLEGLDISLMDYFLPFLNDNLTPDSVKSVINEVLGMGLNELCEKLGIILTFPMEMMQIFNLIQVLHFTLTYEDRTIFQELEGNTAIDQFLFLGEIVGIDIDDTVDHIESVSEEFMEMIKGGTDE